MSEWISVDDGMPRKFQNVLLNLIIRKGGKPIICIGFYSIEPEETPCFILDDKSTILKGVTHWQPLPEPPK